MIVAALLLAQLQPQGQADTPAQASAPAVTGAPALPRAPDIVVLGRRAETSLAALKACIARGCPPREDVAASLTAAEDQFVAGDYEDARATLRVAITRNKKHRKTEPVLVAGLYRAASRLSIHVGDAQSYRNNELSALKVMKDALPSDDRRVLVERLELGTVYEHLGRFPLAHATYASVADTAEKIGADDLFGFAKFYDARMYGGQAIGGGMYEPQARRAIADLAATTQPALRPFRVAAARLGLRIDARNGNGAAVDRLIASYRGEASERPVLIYSPRVTAAGKIGTDGSGTAVTMTDTGIGSDIELGGGEVREQFADVGFSIAPDGTVSDVEVLRNSSYYDPAWMAPVLKAIAGRRYAPLDGAKLPTGLPRLERYTLTAQQVASTGSRVMGQSSRPQIEMIDLSEEGQETGPTR